MKTRIQIFISRDGMRRVGFRIMNKELDNIISYRDKIKKDPFDDFKAWMKDLHINICGFEATYEGLFAYTDSKIDEHPVHTNNN
jgi:hypothetical protein